MTIATRQASAQAFAGATAALKERQSNLSAAQSSFELAQRIERTYAAELCDTVGANVQTRVFKVDSGVVVVQYHNATYTSVTLHKTEPTE